MKANMAASVRQRLLNRSRKEKRPFAELLQYYGMERHWKPFHRRLNQAHVPSGFREIAAHLRTFLAPVIDSAAMDQNAKWPAADPWKP